MVCWLYGVYRPTREFLSYGDVNIAGEGLQILTYARALWLLSSEGSLTCHTHCNSGLPFKMVTSEDPLHSHLVSSVWQWTWAVATWFYDLGLSQPGIEPDLPHERRTPPRRYIKFRVWLYLKGMYIFLVNSLNIPLVFMTSKEIGGHIGLIWNPDTCS